VRRTGREFICRSFPDPKRLDLRVEGVSTDCSTLACQQRSNEYIETIQKQAYTNKGYILGDWIGREAKGGQAWLTYHLSGNEWVQVEYPAQADAGGDFINDPMGGTTQNQFRVDVVKRIGPDVEVNAWFQHERWVAPIYMTGPQSNNTVTVRRGRTGSRRGIFQAFAEGISSAPSRAGRGPWRCRGGGGRGRPGAGAERTISDFEPVTLRISWAHSSMVNSVGLPMLTGVCSADSARRRMPSMRSET
jgi:hypothetical protein